MIDKFYVGLDPGENTGIAVFRRGTLFSLTTNYPWNIKIVLEQMLFEQRASVLVTMEDSRLQPMFNRSLHGGAALKVARNVGEIDAWCKLIERACQSLLIPVRCVSPRVKGAKLNAKAFKSLTGWSGLSNQHERDAAMVALPYVK